MLRIVKSRLIVIAAVCCLTLLMYKLSTTHSYDETSANSLCDDSHQLQGGINLAAGHSGYLGCYLLTKEEVSYQKLTSRIMNTSHDCILYCQDTSHMYSYYQTVNKMCACDNQFYTSGLSFLPCGSSKSQSADVYVTDNIAQTKYSLLNRIWKQSECNCVDGLCSSLRCSNSKQICYVGPKAEFLEEVQEPKCNHTTVEPFYPEETYVQYCTKRLHGFVPANCKSWDKGKIALGESRLYKLWKNSADKTVTIPLTPLTNQQKVLLVTFWRSGSTFLSEFFKGYPNSYHMYEPLFGLMSDEFRQGDERHNTHIMGKRSIEVLDRLFRCDFNSISGLDLSKPVLSMDSFFDACNHSEPDSRRSCVQAHYSSCLSSDMIAIKTVRSTLDWARQLLESTRQNLKVVYLVRDPRGVINSRIHLPTDWFNSEAIKKSAQALCSDMIDNYAVAQVLKKSKYRDQILVIRYEDIVPDNIEAAKYIYKSLSLGDVPTSLISHIKRLTDVKGKKPNTYNTKRDDSVKTAYKWTRQLAYETAKVVDAQCQEAYKLYGYLPIDTKQQMRAKAAFHVESKYKFYFT